VEFSSVWRRGVGYNPYLEFMIWYLLAYTVFCIVFAKLNAEWIEDGLKINHNLNALVHLALACAAGIFFEWYHLFTVLLTGRTVFDWSLSSFRNLGLDYVSPSPKSKIDKWEKWLFRNDGITPKLLYLLTVFVLMNI
jgi:hypothetical protein